MRMVRGADIRRLRDLELLIQGIPSYKSPKLNLEQYVTDANVVAVAVWDAYMRGYLANLRALDLGCGTGRFAIAAALMGARQVVCIDVDYEALEVAREAANRYGLSNIDFVMSDVRSIAIAGRFDVAFQNPPFGIQSERGIDIKFLNAAINHSNVVYTIHKLTTLNYISDRVNSWGCTMSVLDKVMITIPLMYRHHRRRIYKTEVFLARIECPGK